MTHVSNKNDLIEAYWENAISARCKSAVLLQIEVRKKLLVSKMHLYSHILIQISEWNDSIFVIRNESKDCNEFISQIHKIRPRNKVFPLHLLVQWVECVKLLK